MLFRSRAVWLQGVSAIQAQAWHEAQAPFNTVYAQVPGELAPKFALAVACERGERPELAEELYAICSVCLSDFCFVFSLHLRSMYLSVNQLLMKVRLLMLFRQR